MIRKKWFSILLVLCMTVTMLPLTAWAADGPELPETYYNTVWDDAAKTVVASNAPLPEDAKVFTGSFDFASDETTPETVWYAVVEDTTVDNRLAVLRNKTVNLVIKDGATLTCNKGIRVARLDGDDPDGTYRGTLNVYGTTETGGALVAIAGIDETYAAIGGDEEYFSGDVNIHSGLVNATGKRYGAAIGSGAYATVGHPGQINIYGGKVEAYGRLMGAGIGGGRESTGDKIHIFGGDVYAHGSVGETEGTGGGAGIGGGFEAGSNEIVIDGGTVTAVPGTKTAGIGCGYKSGSVNITINGGTVNASGGTACAGIGGSYKANTTGTIRITGGTVTANGGGSDPKCRDTGAGIGAGANETGTLTGTGGDFRGTIEITGGTVTATAGNAGQTPKIGSAGIGAATCGNMTGTITISGGTVIAHGKDGGAGIGAGGEADHIGIGGECEGTVTITGGDIRAIAEAADTGEVGQAIGHGYEGDDNGTIHVDGCLCLYRIFETTPVEYTLREYYAHDETQIHITPCEHAASGQTYTIINAQTHQRFCHYCGDPAEEAHTETDGVCPCGYGTNNRASYAVTSPTTFEIRHPGFTRVPVVLSNLKKGWVKNIIGDGEIVIAKKLVLALYADACGTWRPGDPFDAPDYSLQYLVTDDPDNDVYDELQFEVGEEYLNDFLPIYVYIDPDDWENANPGTYYDTLMVYGYWVYGEGGEYTFGTDFSVDLEIKVPYSYSVSVPGSGYGPAASEYGTVTTDLEEARTGETVTLTATPAPGYLLRELWATDFNGNEIALTDIGNGNYTFVMQEANVIVNAEWCAAWSALQALIDNADDGSTITLGCGYMASEGDGPLVIPEGKTLTIDLNGFPLDRNMTAPAENGSAMKVFGTLTLTDSTAFELGRITGGKTTVGGGGIRVETGGTLRLQGGMVRGNAAQNGGGILNFGSLYIEGGEIVENTAVDSGGGVFNTADGIMYLYGGFIINNAAQNLFGGGICNQGALHVSGSPTVFENVVGEAENNVALLNSTVMTIDGEVDEEALIGVNRGSAAQTGVFTSGLSIGGSADNFSCDNDGYEVRINDDGEAALHYAYSAEWSWQDDFSAAAVILTRLADGETINLAAEIAEEEISPAGCESDRVVRYTASAAFDGETYTDFTDDIALPNTATGHSYGEAAWTWSKSYHSATATFTCEKNDDTQTVNAKVTEVPTPDATCTADGVMVHTATVEFEGKTYTAVQNVRIPATGHSYGEPTWTWSADHRTVTATFACEKGDDERNVTANATEVEVSAATATADQVVKYTVSVTFDGKTYSTETENITMPGTATGTPDGPTPDTPDQPAQNDNICKWDNVDHGTSFWGRFVRFFHSILFFFAHLFGLR